MRTALSASLIAASFVVATAAQSRPDFSGTWKNTDARANPAVNLAGVTGTQEMTIAQDGSSIRINRAYGQDVATITLRLDGSKTKYTLKPGGRGAAATPRSLESRAEWKGDKLVITTDHRTLESATFTKETLSLRGHELVVERVDDTRGEGGPSGRGNLPAKATYARVRNP